MQRDIADKKAGSISIAVKIIVIVLSVTLFYLWSRLEVIGVGYEIAKANNERGKLVEENKRLRLDILSLKSPQRIEALVREKSGLVYPRGEQIMVIK